MSDTLQVAIVSGLFVAIPSLVATIVLNSKSAAVIEYRMDNVDTQIDKLSTRVDKHNNVIERMAVAENSIKSAHHRIDELADR